MSTPRISVNDLGDIYFANKDGEAVGEPVGSFDPKHYEAFRRIEDACGSSDALVAALDHVVANDNLTRLKMLDMDGIRAALNLVRS